MGAVSTVPSFLDALRIALVNRTGLSGAKVYTAAVAAEDRGTKSICVDGEVTIAEESGNVLGTLRVERITVPMVAIATVNGSDLETSISAARRECFALVEQVEAARDADFDCGATIADWQISDRRLFQGFVPDVGFLNQISFTLTILASFAP